MLALLLAAGTASAQWKKLDGEKMLDITAGEWLNVEGDGPTTAALEGKVWLLGFFATW